MAELSEEELFAFSDGIDPAGDPVFALRGELDCTNVERLRGAVERAIALHPKRLTFDAKQLSFVDSSGISVIVLASNNVPEVVIRDAPPFIRMVIDATGLSKVLVLS